MPAETTDRIDPADHLRLAKDFMKKSSWRGLNADDVLSACTFGIVRAAAEYRPGKGAFSTFAYWKMLGQVCQDSELLAYPLRIRRESVRRSGIDPVSPASVAVRDALEACRGIVSCHGHADIDLFDRRDGVDPVESAIAREESEAGIDVLALVAALPERERIVVTRRFGLDGRDPESLGLIAIDLGVSHQRVNQICKQAIDHIRINLGVES